MLSNSFVLAKNQINRNKLDNKAKSNYKPLILCYLYKTKSMDISSGIEEANALAL